MGSEGLPPSKPTLDQPSLGESYHVFSAPKLTPLDLSPGHDPDFEPSKPIPEEGSPKDVNALLDDEFDPSVKVQGALEQCWLGSIPKACTLLQAGSGRLAVSGRDLCIARIEQAAIGACDRPDREIQATSARACLRWGSFMWL